MMQLKILTCQCPIQFSSFPKKLLILFDPRPGCHIYYVYVDLNRKNIIYKNSVHLGEIAIHSHRMYFGLIKCILHILYNVYIYNIISKNRKILQIRQNLCFQLSKISYTFFSSYLINPNL